MLLIYIFLIFIAKTQRKRKSSENDAIKPRKEDVENKQSRKSTRNSCNRGAKKKVLEEANNSKLRQHVQIRVEDCLQNGQKLSAICRRPSGESGEAVSEQQVCSKPATEDTSSTPVPVPAEEESADSSSVEPEVVPAEPEPIPVETLEPVIRTPTPPPPDTETAPEPCDTGEEKNGTEEFTLPQQVRAYLQQTSLRLPVVRDHLFVLHCPAKFTLEHNLSADWLPK